MPIVSVLTENTRTVKRDRLHASIGQYGGIWAHNETGANVVEASTFSLPIEALGGKHPRENPDLVASLNDVLTKLAAQAG
jgi:hypothetical protein